VEGWKVGGRLEGWKVAGLRGTAHGRGPLERDRGRTELRYCGVQLGAFRLVAAVWYIRWLVRDRVARSMTVLALEECNFLAQLSWRRESDVGKGMKMMMPFFLLIRWSVRSMMRRLG
jgi:hypothetical protein